MYPSVLSISNAEQLLQLKKGTKVELPLWMGSMLAVSLPVGSSPLITLDLPTVLGPRVLNALKADPRTIDVRALAPHYYALSSLMLELFDEEEIVDVMSEVIPFSCREDIHQVTIIRHLRSELLLLQTKHTTHVVLLVKVPISFAA